MKKHNQLVPQKRLLLTLMVAQALAFSATAADVPISPIISAGNAAKYEEHQANLWFLLDDSGSMAFASNSHYVPYDPNTTYQLPYKLDGTPMPLPADANKIYASPFKAEANGTPQQISSYNTANYPNHTCAGATDKNNCSIWLNYYVMKYLTLKSALSLVLFSDQNRQLTESVRIGYDTINGYMGNNQTNKGKGNLFPVLPFYGTNAIANKAKMHKWLYSLDINGGTPLRRPTASIIDSVKQYSSYVNSNNPFLDNPGEQQGTNNAALMCRRNYMLVMTDGQWNNNVPAPQNGGVWATSVNSTYTLNDGKTYNPMGPYQRSGTNKLTLADIALYGWKTDLDGNSGNDDLKPKYTEDANGDTVELPTTYSTLSQADRVYWHPWNDPADWQHINTFTMGFKMSDDVGETNPPTMDPDYLDPNWVWNISMDTGWGNQVGYDSAARDLANAAMTGRGQYYDVRTPDDMIDAFKNLLLSAQGGAEKPATTGGGGSAGSSQNLDNSYFFTRYDSGTFTGELIKYDLWTGNNASTCFAGGTAPTPAPVIGTICDSQAWNAAKLVTAKAPDSRNIITGFRDSSGNFSVVDFDETNFVSGSQTRTTLIANFPGELSNYFDDGNSNTDDDETRLEYLVDYVRGDGEYEKNDTTPGPFRDRNEHSYLDGEARNTLGVIMRSTPTFVGIPTAYVGHLDSADQTYSNYVDYTQKFIANNSSGEKEVIYVGSDDGMLHAFSANTGEELFAYIPGILHDKLPKTVVPDEELVLVDGNIDVQAVNSGSTWHRALVAGMGGGARGIFALDITSSKTDSSTPKIADIKSSTKFTWEYGNAQSQAFNSNGKGNIGNILAKPAIIQLQDNNWVAIVGNGYNSESGDAAVIVINLETGAPIQELVLPSKDASKPNGLGPLYFVAYPGKDKDKTNQYDRAYAGDLQGQLWVFDLKGSDITNGIKVIRDTSNNPQPLFTATDANGDAQPITVYPYVAKHPKGYGYLVHFGTGALFERDDLSSTITNSIYAIWDDWVEEADGGLPVTPTRSSEVTKAQLNKIVMSTADVEVQDGSGSTKTVKVRYIEDSTKNPNTTNRKTNWALTGLTDSNGNPLDRGWYIDLDAGERAWQPAYITYGTNNSEAVAYNTVNYDSSGTVAATECYTPGSGVVSWALAFDSSDAADPITEDNIIDINGDHAVSNIDSQVSDGNGGFAVSSSMGILQGLQESGSISYNGSVQRVSDIDTSGSVERTVCYSAVELSSNSSGELGTKTVERCSYFSSWTELK